MSKRASISTTKRSNNGVIQRIVMKLLVLGIIVLSGIKPIQAQINTSVKYSTDIEHRIRTAKQIHQQLKQFKKDSSNIAKQQLKQLKATTDSLVTEFKKQATVENLKRYATTENLKSISPELANLTSRQQQAMAVINQKFAQTNKYTRINKKQLQTMVIQNIENRPEFHQYKSTLEQQLLPYRAQIDQYRYLPQSTDSIRQQITNLDLDSAQLWQELDRFVESEAMKTNYYQALMKEQGQLAQLQNNPQSMLQNNASMFQNEVSSFDLENHPLKTAKQAGMKHFDKIDGSIEQGVEQIDKLKKKYSYVPDSKDLTTAKKKNSLSGVPVKRRIVYGGNFHLDIGDPLFLDFNPVLAYRINTKWAAGIGGTIRFRLSHTDSTDFQYKVPTSGFRGFGEYQFFKSFLVHAEYEVLVDNVFTSESRQKKNQATQSVNIGLGNTFGIYKGLKGKVLLLYNFTVDGEPKYHSPWVVRFGFDIKKLKKK